VKKILTRKT